MPSRSHSKVFSGADRHEAGLRMTGSDTEIVLAQDDATGVEVDLLVDSADSAAKILEASGVVLRIRRNEPGTDRV